MTRINPNTLRNLEELDDESSVISDLLYSRYILRLFEDDSFILSLDEIQFAIDTLCTE